jgi:hypothetical protein
LAEEDTAGVGGMGTRPLAETPKAEPVPAAVADAGAAKASGVASAAPSAAYVVRCVKRMVLSLGDEDLQNWGSELE